MEINLYIKLLKRNLVFIIIVTLIGLLIGFFSTKFSSDSYQIESTYFLQITEDSKTEALDKLLLQNQAINLTDTAVAILESNDFQKNALPPGISMAVRKLAPQVIRFTFTSTDSQVLANSIIKITDDFNTQFATLTSKDINLKSINTRPEVKQPKINQFSAAAIGLIFGLLSAVFLIGLKNYLKI